MKDKPALPFERKQKPERSRKNVPVRPTEDELAVLHERKARFGYKSLSKYLIERGLREGEMITIIDGQLPDVSGLGLCEEIRKRDQITPIIIFSGHGNAKDREAGMLAGANVYLVKPDTSQIIPTVKRLLEQARAANL